MPGAVPVTTEARAQQGLVPSAVMQADPPKPLLIPIAATPVGANPLGMLLAVTGGAFIVGMLARRHAEAAEPPVTRIREGLADLGGQATDNLAALLQRARREVARRVG